MHIHAFLYAYVPYTFITHTDFASRMYTIFGSESLCTDFNKCFITNND